MVPTGASSPVPSFSPPTSQPWNPEPQSPPATCGPQLHFDQQRAITVSSFEHFDGGPGRPSKRSIRVALRVCRRDQRCLGVGTVAFVAAVIEHFNGIFWSVVSSPTPGLGEDVLTGVSALGPNNVWAVGFYVKDVNTDQDPHRTLGRLELEGCFQSQHRTSLRAPIEPTSAVLTRSQPTTFGRSVTTTLPMVRVKSLR
jgi:hypothetical protein